MDVPATDVLYLYALTPAADVSVAASGVGHGVAVVRCDAWSAVVDTVPRRVWAGDQAEERLQQLTWVGPRACIHEEVVEAVMAEGPVYPARFGTLFSSVDALRNTVANHEDALADFFEHVKGAEEWSVKGLLDRQKAVAHRANTPADTAASGTAYLQQRQQEQQVDASLDDWVSDLGDALWEALRDLPRALAVRSTGTPLEGSPAPVFHWAALVPAEQRAAFLRRVEELDAEYAPKGLHLEASGPWPPYTFRTLDTPSL